MPFENDILLTPQARGHRGSLRLAMAALLGCLLMMAALVAQSTAAEKARSVNDTHHTEASRVDLPFKGGRYAR